MLQSFVKSHELRPKKAKSDEEDIPDQREPGNPPFRAAHPTLASPEIISPHR
jgi:hypothetical protein